MAFSKFEITANLKYIFSFSILMCFAIFIMQIALMKFESESVNVNNDWTITESSVSQFRNLIWLINLSSEERALSSSLAKEYENVANSLTVLNDSLFTEHFDLIRKSLVERKTSYTSSGTTSINDVIFMKKCNDYIKEKRFLYNNELNTLQERIDFLNMLILIGACLLLFIFVYTTVFALSYEDN